MLSVVQSRSATKHGRRILPDRVVVLNDASVPRGGATGVALSLCQTLRDRGIPVTFVGGDNKTASRNFIATDHQISVGSQHIMEGHRGTAVVRGIYNWDAAKAVSDWIERYDTSRTIYHLHGWSKILSPAVFRALRNVRPRVVVHAHDFFLGCPNGGYFNFQKQKECTLRPLSPACITTNCDRRNYAHKLWRVARHGVRAAVADLNNFGLVIVVHEAMIDLLEAGGVPRLRQQVLRNTVMPWTKTRIVSEDNRQFFYVGRLELDKGVLELAEAARSTGIKLVLAGDGALANHLANAYPEIQQLGWCSRTKIEACAKQSRALIVPSTTRESFGLAALEAAMSGLPVIISKYALISEEIEKMGFGVACDPCNQEDLQSSIQTLAHNQKIVARMSVAAFHGARSLAPTPDAWTDELLWLYSKVLHAAP